MFCSTGTKDRTSKIKRLADVQCQKPRWWSLQRKSKAILIFKVDNRFAFDNLIWVQDKNYYAKISKLIVVCYLLTRASNSFITQEFFMHKILLLILWKITFKTCTAPSRNNNDNYLHYNFFEKWSWTKSAEAIWSLCC